MRVQNSLIFVAVIACANARAASEPPKLLGPRGDGAIEVSWQGSKSVLTRNHQVGPWSLMAVLTAEKTPIAVFEDFGDRTGNIIFVGTGGVRADFAKSLEPTFAEPSALYHGHKLEDVLNSDPDLLGNEFLAAGGDPEYPSIAACFPPITSLRTHNFVGTHESRDKVGFDYGAALRISMWQFMRQKSAPSGNISKSGRAW